MCSNYHHHRRRRRRGEGGRRPFRALNNVHAQVLPYSGMSATHQWTISTLFFHDVRDIG
jgi:hypothetical protein